MVAEDLIALAAAGGTALVGAAAQDAWGLAKKGFTRLLGRGEKDREAALSQQLDRTHAAVQAAGDDTRELARQEATWAGRLEDLLIADPKAATSLRELLDHIAAESRSAGHVVLHANAYDNAQQANLGHGQQIVTFGTPPPPAR